MDFFKEVENLFGLNNQPEMLTDVQLPKGYKLIKRLGKGGCGETYLVSNPRRKKSCR